MRYLVALLWLASTFGCLAKDKICPMSCKSTEIICDGECRPMTEKCGSGPACRRCERICRDEGGVDVIECGNDCIPLNGPENEQESVRQLCEERRTGTACDAEDLEE